MEPLGEPLGAVQLQRERIRLAPQAADRQRAADRRADADAARVAHGHERIRGRSDQHAVDRDVRIVHHLDGQADLHRRGARLGPGPPKGPEADADALVDDLPRDAQCDIGVGAIGVAQEDLEEVLGVRRLLARRLCRHGDDVAPAWQRVVDAQHDHRRVIHLAAVDDEAEGERLQAAAAHALAPEALQAAGCVHDELAAGRQFHAAVEGDADVHRHA
mmetsp:Transcript_99878/g.258066  ORF Transcript_99878/g.258066 Transcript_99878/m.258066 type:complete len:217 (-) Transcript_99878:246-896(-)